MNTTVSFACSACGKCCNSPPLMTLPELFHHQDLFVGALGVRLRGANAFDLVTLGLDYPSAGACPSRRPDGLCGIHGNRKPAMCSTVPLDPFQSDALQQHVLIRRGSGVDYIGADCIVQGERADRSVLVADGEVIDLAYRRQLHGHRHLLADEHAIWGEAVARLLSGQLGPQRAPGGMLILPLVPALSVLAGASVASRDRCLQYLRRQIDLLERKIEAALQRKRPEDKEVTADYRHFEKAYRRTVLALEVAALPSSRGDASKVEAYLELSAQPSPVPTA